MKDSRRNRENQKPKTRAEKIAAAEQFQARDRSQRVVVGSVLHRLSPAEIDAKVIKQLGEKYDIAHRLSQRYKVRA